MRRIIRLLAVTALCALACWPSRPANAQLLYDMVGPPSPPGAAGNFSAPTTAGFEFTLSAPATLTGLGGWDHGPDGLAYAHDVGLWNSAGTLLASTTVSSASTVVASADPFGQWMFESVAAVALAPGTYVLGMHFDGTVADLLRFFQPTTPMPGATMGTDRYTYGGSLTKPATTYFGGTSGFYGPNAQFGVAAVPEASSVALLLAGGAPLGLIARRRRRRKA